MTALRHAPCSLPILGALGLLAASSLACSEEIYCRDDSDCDFLRGERCAPGTHHCYHPDAGSPWSHAGSSGSASTTIPLDQLCDYLARGFVRHSLNAFGSGSLQDLSDVDCSPVYRSEEEMIRIELSAPYLEHGMPNLELSPSHHEHAPANLQQGAPNLAHDFPGDALAAPNLAHGLARLEQTPRNMSKFSHGLLMPPAILRMVRRVCSKSPAP